MKVFLIIRLDGGRIRIRTSYYSNDPGGPKTYGSGSLTLLFILYNAYKSRLPTAVFFHRKISAQNFRVPDVPNVDLASVSVCEKL
jgi:hypothetical protein